MSLPKLGNPFRIEVESDRRKVLSELDSQRQPDIAKPDNPYPYVSQVLRLIQVDSSSLH